MRKIPRYQKPCACGCGELIWNRSNKGKIRKYFEDHQFSDPVYRKKISESRTGSGNPMYGRPRTKEDKEKISNALSGKYVGDKSWCWKGDEIKYCTLHMWVRKYLPEPKLCQMCNKVPPYDLANKTGIYNRDLVNWFYLCRRCHIHSDGRLYNLIYYERKHPRK